MDNEHLYMHKLYFICYAVISPSTIWKNRTRPRATMVAALFSHSRGQNSCDLPTPLFSVYALCSMLSRMTFDVRTLYLRPIRSIDALHTLYLRLSTRSDAILTRPRLVLDRASVEDGSSSTTMRAISSRSRRLSLGHPRSSLDCPSTLLALSTLSVRLLGRGSVF